MNIGLGYLTGSGKKAETAEPQIKEMDLEHIRKYMCPISNGDFRRCLNCQGLRTCQVGQRVAVLLAEREKKSETAKWKKVMDSMPDKPAGNEDEAKRTLLRDACASGNAWDYIMRVTGKSRDAAKEALLELIRKYPGLAAEYGGSRRIMQRPRKVVSITAEEPAKAEESTPQAQQMEPGKDPNAGRRKTAIAMAEKRREEALAMYRECLQQQDPVAFYMQQRSSTERAAKLFLYRMRKLYGEMAEEQKPQQQETPEEPEKMEQATEDEDSVSLEEFLGQYAPEDQAPQENAQKGPENADAVQDEETIGQYGEAMFMARKTRENAGFAMEALKRIMVSADLPAADRIKAAEVVLQFYANITAGGGEL